MLDLVESGTDKGYKESDEGYTPRQIRLINRFAALLRQSNPKMLTALETLVMQMPSEEKGGS